MSDDELLAEFYDWSAPALQGITLAKLKEKGWMRLNVGAPDKRAPHAQGKFKTPSGIIGQPVTWDRNGTQYVTVTSGIGGTYARSPDPNLAHVPKGGSLWTFKLMAQ
jgi:hypothetical protein